MAANITNPALDPDLHVPDPTYNLLDFAGNFRWIDDFGLILQGGYDPIRCYG